MDTPIAISERQKPIQERKHLIIGCLIFPRMDQIHFTGPFEVLSRLPDSTLHVIAKMKSPVRDIQGLILTPEMSIAEAPEFDVLLVPGGFGQQQLMNDEEVLSLIRNHFAGGEMGVLSLYGSFGVRCGGVPPRATGHDALGSVASRISPTLSPRSG
jgi:transcriptional regulator GlxA family with amidase domain